MTQMTIYHEEMICDLLIRHRDEHHIKNHCLGSPLSLSHLNRPTKRTNCNYVQKLCKSLIMISIMMRMIKIIMIMMRMIKVIIMHT